MVIHNKNKKLKGEKDNIEVHFTERKKFIQPCAFCEEKPSGYGTEALIYNYKTHLDKHLRKGDITQEQLDNEIKRLHKQINKEK